MPNESVVAARAIPRSVSAIGDIMQLGYVPRDWDAALSFWLAVGAGPFFVTEKVSVAELRYRGIPAEIDYTLALGYWGGLQIELIRQNDDAPSIYREWAESGRDGLHHVCAVTSDIAAARATCEAAGGTVVQDLVVPGGAAIYVDFGGDGPLYEAIELPDAVVARFAAMREASRTWDGSDPVRIRQS